MNELFPAPRNIPVRVFRFLWIGKHGPNVRCFTDVHVFSAYIQQVRALCGFDVVEFRTPVLAVGVLS